MRRTARLGFGLLTLLICSTPALAAEMRKSPLEGAPAVRHRYEMRDKRFVIGPSFSISLNRALRHAVLFGARLQFHFNDYVSLGADIAYGVGFDAGLANELEENFKKRGAEPVWTDAKKHFSDVKLAGDVRVAFTPFAGKMAIFSKLFFAYDFYLFGGFGFALTQNEWSAGDPVDNTRYVSADYDEANEGFKPGFAWGVGMNMYFAKFFAVGIEIKDLIFTDNESGEDLTRGVGDGEGTATNGRPVVNKDDNELLNHFFFGINFTFLFPTMPNISD